MVPPDDESGSRARVADLYARYSEELLAFVRASRPISKVDAADVIQQVFVELLRWCDNHPGQPIHAPRAFLYKVTSRGLGKHLDRSRRTPTDPGNATELSEVPEGAVAGRTGEDDAEYLAGLTEDRRQVLRAMRRLGEPEGSSIGELQLATYFRFWAGLTEQQIGDILDLTRETVARRLRTARTRLQTILQELDEPGAAHTSTTLLKRWWRSMEARLDEVAPTEVDEPDS